MDEIKVDVAIIGSGTSGLNAMGRVRKAGKSFVLINGGEAGTTCARVGCMPSKVLIQVAEDFHRRKLFSRCGIKNHENMSLDHADVMEYVQDIRDIFVDRVLSHTTDEMGEEFIEGYARFIEAGLLEIDNGQRIRADKVIIATGSSPILPEDWRQFGERVITTDELFELEDLPESMAVIGLGVIGLELGQSLNRLGVKVTGFDLAGSVGNLQDPSVIESVLRTIGDEMPLHMGYPANIEATENEQLRVSAGEQSVVVDKVLVCLGRHPNLSRLGLKKIGVQHDNRGIPVFNRNTMQLGDWPIFIAGDVNHERGILHEAGDEGKMAGFNAANDTVRAFKRKTPLSINFCDPNIAIIGERYNALDMNETAIGEIAMAPVGRALIMGKNKGIIRLYACKADGRLLGAELFAVKGENLAHLLAWSIQMGMTVGEMLRMPFYHPVMEEALQAALYDLYYKLDCKNDGDITELTNL
ncbi:MAG: dihydrolipoyl dehydrogenase [gamma proteobacterium symbiont of Bathyaustriella thionipta]|nr:dihydrolipoyl dehydrogenase [gamma proteobacterium symbiont of Bathyaustriella thionipta]